MTVVGVLVVMGLLALVLMWTGAMGAGGSLFAAVWGFPLGGTPAGPPVGRALDPLGAALWQAVTAL